MGYLSWQTAKNVMEYGLRGVLTYNVITERKPTQSFKERLRIGAELLNIPEGVNLWDYTTASAAAAADWFAKFCNSENSVSCAEVFEKSVIPHLHAADKALFDLHHDLSVNPENAVELLKRKTASIHVHFEEASKLTHQLVEANNDKLCNLLSEQSVLQKTCDQLDQDANILKEGVRSLETSEAELKGRLGDLHHQVSEATRKYHEANAQLQAERKRVEDLRTAAMATIFIPFLSLGLAIASEVCDGEANAAHEAMCSRQNDLRQTQERQCRVSSELSETSQRLKDTKNSLSTKRKALATANEKVQRVIKDKSRLAEVDVMLKLNATPIDVASGRAKILADSSKQARRSADALANVARQLIELGKKVEALGLANSLEFRGSAQWSNFKLPAIKISGDTDEYLS
ncbi:hypothetical protein HK104_009625 [Borealophlyctis nickersoniae]|nr:hypothetical protein HK104_009625 [Borealophlyctis nickersoniae]